MTDELMALAKDVRDTGRELMAWANGHNNAGHLSQDAHHICIHINSAMALLASKIEARAAKEPEA